MNNKDILIKNYNKYNNEVIQIENKAIVESDSADGMLFMKKKFENITKKEIKGEEVNNLLNELKEQKLKFSFKAA